MLFLGSMSEVAWIPRTGHPIGHVHEVQPRFSGNCLKRISSAYQALRSGLLIFQKRSSWLSVFVWKHIESFAQSRFLTAPMCPATLKDTSPRQATWTSFKHIGSHQIKIRMLTSNHNSNDAMYGQKPEDRSPAHPTQLTKLYGYQPPLFP